MPGTNYEQSTGTPEQTNPAEVISDANAGRVNFTQTESGLQTLNMTVKNVEPLDISKLRMYGWGKIPAIEQQDVVNGINNLEEPFNRDITDIIKAGDVKELQRYLNSKIDSGDINGEKLKQKLKSMGIWLDGQNHIKEDGKFGPQTLETLKLLIKEQGGETPSRPTPIVEHPTNPEQKETWDASWIKTVMEDQLDKLEDNDQRNIGHNFNVDAKTSKISITTREIPGGEKNTCEINWKTGAVNVICGNYSYPAPFHLRKLILNDKGLPTQDEKENSSTIRAFTAIGNLMNKLKNVAVFQGKGAIEYQTGRTVANVLGSPAVGGVVGGVLTGLPGVGTIAGGAATALYGSTGIHLNNGPIGGATDTLLVKRSSWKEVGRLCHKDFLNENMQINIASMLTAMKLDQGRISWDPDVVDSRRLYPDPLDQKHQTRIRYYQSKRRPA